MPLYESDVRTVKSELATFFEAFPNGTIWANTVDGRGYDMVFMGQHGPAKIDLDGMFAGWPVRITRRWRNRSSTSA